MDLPVVVGVDGSEPSLQTVDWAVDEAARHGVPLRLIYASLWERYAGTSPLSGTARPSEEIMAEQIIASGVERARRRNADVKVSGEVVPDDAVSALLQAGHEASVLVTGSRGRGELTELLLGPVSLTVAARAGVCPVIVVRGSEPNRQGDFQRVVVGVGDSPERLAAVRFAFREAEARGCPLHAVRAWRFPAHEHVEHPFAADDAERVHEQQASTELTDALREALEEHPRVQVHAQTIEGSAHRALLHASAEADLLVVGALRRHGDFGLQLGRVAHAALHHAHCPVAVVPQQA
ncbi:universal stress protein [Streptomyces sp. PSKA54]|uniref:Universal stress protein n=1 Tax=Streptomyces himalayensis subsp. aureolus TaxID=2758039 RepID=A0A7W2D1I6_9ACTN|nr:universal stress protein [Streptomyces himalayensis]MBA4863059.1 universal stress protein [Streptomyces himalayensis subsp. aureolus]